MRSGDELSGRLIADPSSVDKERHGAPQYWESHNGTPKVLGKSEYCICLLKTSKEPKWASECQVSYDIALA